MFAAADYRLVVSFQVLLGKIPKYYKAVSLASRISIALLQTDICRFSHCFILLISPGFLGLASNVYLGSF